MLSTSARSSLQREGIQRIAPVRRGTTIYGPESQADSVYFVDSGYVKLVKRGDDGKEVMLSIIPPGKIFGEQAIAPGGVRGVSAQMLQEGALYQIPRAVFVEFANASPDVWRAVAELMMERQHEYEQKIALLCLQDVEYRILHYLRIAVNRVRNGPLRMARSIRSLFRRANWLT